MRAVLVLSNDQRLAISSVSNKRLVAAHHGDKCTGSHVASSWEATIEGDLCNIVVFLLDLVEAFEDCFAYRLVCLGSLEVLFEALVHIARSVVSYLPAAMPVENCRIDTLESLLELEYIEAVLTRVI